MMKFAPAVLALGAAAMAALLAAAPALAQAKKVNLGVVHSRRHAQLHGRHRVLGQRGQEGPGEGATPT